MSTFFIYFHMILYVFIYFHMIFRNKIIVFTSKGSDNIKKYNLNKELKIVNAEVKDFEFKSFESATVLLDDKYYIGIKKNLPEEDRFWILQHELEHIKTKTLYQPNDDKFTINKKERIANDSLVTKLGLPALIYKMLAAGKSKEEIIKILEITEHIYEYAYNYIIRNYLKLGGSNEK